MSSDLASSSQGAPDRLVPETVQGQLIEVEQVSRYLWAAQAATARLVLDAGCGTGYGSRLLADGGAREVVGVDIARAVLDVAAGGMPESVRLQTADLRRLEFEDDKFELIVCFEVLEHVDDPLTVMNELVRVLSPGGLLLVSSPNRGLHQPGNPYHLNEFTPTALESALTARLNHVRLLRQHDYVASALLSDAADRQEHRETREGDLTVRKLDLDSPGEAIYTVAVASDAELPVMRDLAGMAGTISLREWLSILDTQATAIAERNHQIDELRTRLDEGDRLTELLEQAEHRSAEVPELKQRLAELELELEDERRAAAAARKEADQLDRMLMYGRRMLRLVRPLIEPLRRLRRKLRS